MVIFFNTSELLRCAITIKSDEFGTLNPSEVGVDWGGVLVLDRDVKKP